MASFVEEPTSLSEFSNSDTLVQKYGGTSVGTAKAMLNVANIIRKSLHSTKVVAVLSAMSSHKKSEGTTSKLIKAMENINNTEVAIKILDEIQEYHVSVAKEVIKNEETLNDIVESINKECTSLKTFMSAIAIVGEISAKSKDYIISVGEKLSANLFSGILRSQGIDSEYINLEHAVNYDDFSNTPNLSDKFFQILSEKFAVPVQACLDQHKVPVVTGFFGLIPGSLLNTIGRGYTDLCAALIAVGIKARELQIWKEVDGVFTADPRKTPKAKLLKELSASEAEELTFFGSEVIHPYVMKQAVLSGIPVKIKCVFNPEDQGTLIVLNSKTEDSRSDETIYENEPTAVTIKDNATLIHIDLNTPSSSYSTIYSLLHQLEKNGISPDLVSISQQKVLLTLTETGSKLEKFIKMVKDNEYAEVKRNMCILALITPPTVDKLSLATRMLNILSENNIKVEMISHGASNNNIACVISNEESIKAMQLVHDECIIESLAKNDELKEKIFEEEINTNEISSVTLKEGSIDTAVNKNVQQDKSKKVFSLKKFFRFRKNKITSVKK
ncbi:aspartate kinase [Neocallimastix lanati (nom. inval.)]|jgi:aspartate kinase|uniref:Aspartokinase n=1 Tax=Neocallimastix californiae TaxID=1754190 RepID=A0A1Y2DBK3_9FUNG|nr:aspartate kinase [Neocallimastix sp. JGI-2020a]ORY56045.1 aspartate kinase [Neocallimastix californiae]|eukprot:ORY56045.1 aspartate kinase [Neocallimastix californiae]